MIAHSKNKILLLYHSGAGNTKFISYLLYKRLMNKFNIDIRQVNPGLDVHRLKEYSLLIFGFPTYHCEPSLSMKDFIKRIPEFENTLKAFIFTSYGLYNGDSLRIAFKMLKEKNISLSGCYDFRSPASDGVLMFPSFLRFMFHFEKSFITRVERMISSIEKWQGLPEISMPHSKWYVPINNFLKYFGEKEYGKMRDNLHVLSGRCTGCNLCVKECPRGCWIEDNDTPVFQSPHCEFCLKCVHNCPTQSIIFSRRMKDKPRLNRKFFMDINRELFPGE